MPCHQLSSHSLLPLITQLLMRVPMKATNQTAPIRSRDDYTKIRKRKLNQFFKISFDPNPNFHFCLFCEDFEKKFENHFQPKSNQRHLAAKRRTTFVTRRTQKIFSKKRKIFKKKKSSKTLKLNECFEYFTFNLI